MRNILYLVHRLPYPPNKGDKLCSFHLLRHLARRHRVFLGTFIDDPHDAQFVDVLRPLCAELRAETLHPLSARLRSVMALAVAEPFTLAYYRSAALKEWVEATVHDAGIDTAVVFSSAMAQFVSGLPQLRIVADLVDVDSSKWREYAERRAWPLSWLYRRESARLLTYERKVVGGSAQTFFVTEAEKQLFCRVAPEFADRVSVGGIGVDANYFDPSLPFESPYSEQELAIVLTGAMDYWPNVDAACWFVHEILPRLRAKWPNVRFYIVGMRPTSTVRRLAGAGVVVTGRVKDTRPYLRHARAVVAPIRLARGIQTKVLEAMAMARPVVATSACTAGIDALGGRDLLQAAEATQFVEQLELLLCNLNLAETIGQSARNRVMARYNWDVSLSVFDSFLPCAEIEPGHEAGAPHQTPVSGEPVAESCVLDTGSAKGETSFQRDAHEARRTISR